MEALAKQFVCELGQQGYGQGQFKNINLDNIGEAAVITILGDLFKEIVIENIEADYAWVSDDFISRGTIEKYINNLDSSTYFFGGSYTTFCEDTFDDDEEMEENESKEEELYNYIFNIYGNKIKDIMLNDETDYIFKRVNKSFVENFNNK